MGGSEYGFDKAGDLSQDARSSDGKCDGKRGLHFEGQELFRSKKTIETGMNNYKLAINTFGLGS